MIRTRTVITALSVLLVLALGACSGDEPEPKLAPPGSSVPSLPSTTPTQTMGPVEAVRAWVEAQNNALATGETTELRSLSANSCRGCQDFIQSIERVYRDGGHFSTDGWTVIAAKARSASGQVAVVDVGVSIAGGETVVEAGREPVAYEAEKRIMLFKLTSGSLGMQVRFVGFVQ